MATLRESDVTIISGGTGCGKSTQVPQHILDEWLDAGSGDEVSVICAQPRRLAAVGLAERVAAERDVRIGAEVGYSIRLESKRSESATRLLFCTTGVLLRMLQGDPGLRRSGTKGRRVTHVIVDEVHERSCDADLLLLALRDLLASTDDEGEKESDGRSRRKLKVILMSATLDAADLTAYFESHARLGPPIVVGCLAIEGRAFPVERLFLSDAIEACGYSCDLERDHCARLDLTRADINRRVDGGGDGGGGAAVIGADGLPAAAEKRELTATEALIAKNLAARAKKESARAGSSAKGLGVVGGRTQAWIDAVGALGMVRLDARLRGQSRRTLDALRAVDHSMIHRNTTLIVALVRHALRGSGSGSGSSSGGKAVLIFMPGVREIGDVVDALERCALPLHVLPLHGQLTSASQRRIFDAPPRGKIKVVVATNIAEASVTIPDVGVVIDAGVHKEMRFDVGLGIARLSLSRVSQASATQRAGRAGRVRAGTCYHLFTEHEWSSSMEPHETPEIRRAPLDSLCLRVAAMEDVQSATTRGRRTIPEALQRLPAPPDAKAIEHALRTLRGLGALRPSGGGAGSGSAVDVVASSLVLTPLGRVLAALPTAPRVGKLLALGCAFRCLTPALIVAASLSYRSPFLTPSNRDDRDAAQAAQAALDSTSDHIAALRAYRGWEDAESQTGYARRHYLSTADLRAMRDTVRQYKSHLARLGLPSLYSAAKAKGGGGGGGDEGGYYDARSGNAALIKALLVGAFYPSVATVAVPVKKRGKQGGRRKVGAETLELKTLDVFGKRAARSASGELNDRLVCVHPGSVLARSARFVAKAKQGLPQSKKQGQKKQQLTRKERNAAATLVPLHLVFFGRMKTSRVFLTDATLVGPLPILLFGAAMRAEVQTEARTGVKTNTLLVIDDWVSYYASTTAAEAIAQLRAAIAALVSASLGDGRRGRGGGGGGGGGASAAAPPTDATAGLVAQLLQAHGSGDYDTGAPLPSGWRLSEDVATSLPLYTNVHTGEAQRAWPTRAASTTKAAPKLQMSAAQREIVGRKLVAAKVEASDLQDLAVAKAPLTAVDAEAAANAKRAAAMAEAEEVKQSILAVQRASDAAAAAERAKSAAKVMTVAELAKSLGLASAMVGAVVSQITASGYDDAALAEVIECWNCDPEGEGLYGVDAFTEALAEVGGMRPNVVAKINAKLTGKAKKKHAAAQGGKSGTGKGKGKAKGNAMPSATKKKKKAAPTATMKADPFGGAKKKKKKKKR